MLICTLAAAATIAASTPDLPVFSDATFDEAVARHWPASAMVLVVANEQFTQEDWERSTWADPDLDEFFRSKRIPVVYANINENRAACWLLDLDSYPAVILFIGGEERARRYGLRYGEADELIAWFGLVSAGSSPAAKLRERIAAEPENIRLRSDLIHELHTAGDTRGAHTEIAWFLENPGSYVLADRDMSESEVHKALLWIIGGMRDRFGGAGLTPEPEAFWDTVERIAGLLRTPVIGVTLEFFVHRPCSALLTHCGRV